MIPRGCFRSNFRLDQVVDLEIHSNRKIERLTTLNAPFHHGGDVGDDHRLQTRAFSSRAQLTTLTLVTPRAENLELAAPASAHTNQATQTLRPAHTGKLHPCVILIP